MNITEAQQGDNDYLFMANGDSDQAPSSIWVVDSGCSNHITWKKELFKDLDESLKHTVTLGDNNKVQVEGKGSLAITANNGKVKFLKNVQYVHKLANNLLSVGVLVS